MKKNYVLRAAALLLACCMFCLCTVTGTMAKWVKSSDMTGKMIRAGIFCVALSADSGKTWTTIGEGSIGSPLEVDLYDELYEDDVLTKENAGTTYHVDTSVQNIIAPGTGGKFMLKFANYSEVDIVIDVAIEGTGSSSSGPKIQWKGDDPSVGFSTGLISALSGVQATNEFQWYWVFEEGNPQDQIDTKLGVDSATVPVNYTLPLKITATQID